VPGGRFLEDLSGRYPLRRPVAGGLNVGQQVSFAHAPDVPGEELAARSSPLRTSAYTKGVLTFRTSFT
jgi:hypothetical protein